LEFRFPFAPQQIQHTSFCSCAALLFAATLLPTPARAQSVWDKIKQKAKQAEQQTFSGTGRDKQSAEDDATHKAIQQIEKDILDRTRVRAVACNDRCDQLTNHGRNPGSQADAAAKTESDDPEPAGGKP
jgi:hypothetical protein